MRNAFAFSRELRLSLLISFCLFVSSSARSKDPYKAQALRTSYKKAARKWHPDKNPSPKANERFIKVAQLAEHFVREARLLFAVVDCQQQPAWHDLAVDATCGLPSEEQNLDALMSDAGPLKEVRLSSQSRSQAPGAAALIVWHPKRLKYQTMGSLEQIGVGAAVIKLETLLGCSGQWTDATWPELT
eukprot:jgi/Mesen1/703/ME000109S_10919